MNHKLKAKVTMRDKCQQRKRCSSFKINSSNQFSKKRISLHTNCNKILRTINFEKLIKLLEHSLTLIYMLTINK